MDYALIKCTKDHLTRHLFLIFCLFNMHFLVQAATLRKRVENKNDYKSSFFMVRDLQASDGAMDSRSSTTVDARDAYLVLEQLDQRGGAGKHTEDAYSADNKNSITAVKSKIASKNRNYQQDRMQDINHMNSDFEDHRNFKPYVAIDIKAKKSITSNPELNRDLGTKNLKNLHFNARYSSNRVPSIFERSKYEKVDVQPSGKQQFYMKNSRSNLRKKANLNMISSSNNNNRAKNHFIPLRLISEAESILGLEKPTLKSRKFSPSDTHIRNIDEDLHNKWFSDLKKSRGASSMSVKKQEKSDSQKARENRSKGKQYGEKVHFPVADEILRISKEVYNPFFRGRAINNLAYDAIEPQGCVRTIQDNLSDKNDEITDKTRDTSLMQKYSLLDHKKGAKINCNDPELEIEPAATVTPLIIIVPTADVGSNEDELIKNGDDIDFNKLENKADLEINHKIEQLDRVANFRDEDMMETASRQSGVIPGKILDESKNQILINPYTLYPLDENGPLTKEFFSGNPIETTSNEDILEELQKNFGLGENEGPNHVTSMNQNDLFGTKSEEEAKIGESHEKHKGAFMGDAILTPDRIIKVSERKMEIVSLIDGDQINEEESTENNKYGSSAGRSNNMLQNWLGGSKQLPRTAHDRSRYGEEIDNEYNPETPL